MPDWIENIGRCIEKIRRWIKNIGRWIETMQRCIETMDRWVLVLDEPMKKMQRWIETMERWMFLIDERVKKMERWIEKIGRSIEMRERRGESIQRRMFVRGERRSVNRNLARGRLQSAAELIATPLFPHRKEPLTRTTLSTAWKRSPYPRCQASTQGCYSIGKPI